MQMRRPELPQASYRQGLATPGIAKEIRRLLLFLPGKKNWCDFGKTGRLERVQKSFGLSWFRTRHDSPESLFILNNVSLSGIVGRKFDNPARFQGSFRRRPVLINFLKNPVHSGIDWPVEDFSLFGVERNWREA